MDILLANPRGFCAGVDRAIEIVQRALDLFKAVRQAGGERGLRVFDATCPLVTKVHMEVARHCRAGRDVVLIGHAGHPEVEGTLGQWVNHSPRGNNIYLVENPADVGSLEVTYPDNVAFVTQTTLSVDDTQAVIDALRKKFPAIEGPKHDDICYATQNRQDAVKELAGRVDLVLVVGSVNSSNSNRLRELAEKRGVPAHLVDGADDVREEWLRGLRAIGVTAGASAPESLVQGVIQRLQELGGASAEEISGIPETIEFALPRELRVSLRNSS
jgi:4-hydroxy-3-methylbut-2-enyl diphosphate reductase